MNHGYFYTYYTLTSLHAGAGEGSGAVDLAIQREKHTHFPAIYSSSLKGALRSGYQRQNTAPGESDEDAKTKKEFENWIFGEEKNETGSGQMMFVDARILLFPVRLTHGVFKWVTCPFVLNRLRTDRGLADRQSAEPPPFQPLTDCEAWTPLEATAGDIVLEDFRVTLQSKPSHPAIQLLETVLCGEPAVLTRGALNGRLLIVSDDVFALLVTTAMPVVARNELKDGTKTSNNLWYEELLPSDTILYSILLSFNPDTVKTEKFHEWLNGNILQIGANETIGYGLVKLAGKKIEKEENHA